ncbi:hypothetical protein VroAM7_16740 [Vibrio rotiferianus]|uniref:ATP-binding protein n=1 Tax=Vibrio rotiferianus TaxID=190895 RepID=A0A510I6D4_9VIBR|nr:hypothetical protein [Vibrio rotiferianus]BBL89021.1 hypothetical protein VroAM7_16740 [Vibrio rotiferianus]
MITRNIIENESHHWQGSSISPEPLVEVIKYLKSLGYSGSEEHYTHIYESLLEGMLNIKQHAYQPEEENKWTIDVTYHDDTFVVVLRDFGLTIPVTYLKKTQFEGVKYIDDSVLIREAVSAEFCSEFRGLGLKSIVSQISKGTFDKIKISSGKGALVYSPEGCDQIRLPVTAKGTSITFQLTSDMELK